MSTVKIVIAGSRTITDERPVWERIDAWLEGKSILPESVEVYCGCAKGADMIGLRWAESRGAQIRRFPADWERHGRAAGMLRNLDMVQAKPDWVLVFVDKPLDESRGSAHMVAAAREAGIHGSVWTLAGTAAL